MIFNGFIMIVCLCIAKANASVTPAYSFLIIALLIFFHGHQGIVHRFVVFCLCPVVPANSFIGVAHSSGVMDLFCEKQRLFSECFGFLWLGSPGIPADGCQQTNPCGILARMFFQFFHQAVEQCMLCREKTRQTEQNKE
jgi:hypothetical protein